jgi:uncharacterized protein (TIGR03437 family)
MERRRKLVLGKMAAVMGAIPFLIWAHEYGPDAGYSGVPREQGNCTAIGCHVGTANSPSNQGSVKVNFPNGLTYTPGVKQHLSVTIADPTQRAWGFQLTARLASNTATLAGGFQSTDKNTLLMCASTSLFQEQDVAFSAGKAQTCPATMQLQYIEHSLDGYNATKGQTNSATYEFDWTPPATDSGNIQMYLAGNAANGDLTSNGDHIYVPAPYTLTPAAGGGGTAPAIASAGVVNGASFQPGIVPNSWITIQGANLSSTTNTWDNAIVGGKLPTRLDGVSVSVGGKPAYVYFVSSTQINVLAPDAGTGSMSVTVTNSGGTSAAATATSQTESPAFFLWAGKYTVATRQDATWAVKNGTFTTTTVPAKPGDVIILWGTGFGPTTPAAPVGVQVPGDQLYKVDGVTVTIDNAPAQVFGTALSPGFAGLYQVAIQVPSTARDGDLPIVASVGGVQSPANVFITVQK